MIIMKMVSRVRERIGKEWMKHLGLWLFGCVEVNISSNIMLFERKKWKTNTTLNPGHPRGQPLVKLPAQDDPIYRRLPRPERGGCAQGL
jgi:hypothetical protein